MNVSLPRNMQRICNTYARHRSYSVLQISRTLNSTLQQRLVEKVPQTVYIQPYPTASLHTSCCQYQTKNDGDGSSDQSGFLGFMKKNWTMLTIASAVAGTLFLTYSLQQYKKSMQLARALEQTEFVGEAKVGVEDWELIDTEGKKFTNKDLLGKWCIYYFGFTHCPDICPDELDKLSAVSDTIGMNSKLPNIEVVFVSVDPERDTPAVIKEYLSEFSKKFIGLTGTLDEVKHAGRQYRVYFSKGKTDSDGDYIVDHSIITYLVDPNGKFVEFYMRSNTALEIANKVEKKMLEYKDKYKTFAYRTEK